MQKSIKYLIILLLFLGISNSYGQRRKKLQNLARYDLKKLHFGFTLGLNDLNFNINKIKKFLFSTRFLFQNLDRVVIFDSNFNLIGDTDTLDLDPRSFSSRLDIVELEILDKEKSKKIVETKNINKEKTVSLKDILTNYSWSKDYGKPFTFIQ